MPPLHFHNWLAHWPSKENDTQNLSTIRLGKPIRLHSIKKVPSNISWQDGCQGVFSWQLQGFFFCFFFFQKLLGNHWEVKCAFPFIKWGKEPIGIIKICEYLHYTDIGYQDSIYTQKHGFLCQMNCVKYCFSSNLLLIVFLHETFFSYCSNLYEVSTLVTNLCIIERASLKCWSLIVNTYFSFFF